VPDGQPTPPRTLEPFYPPRAVALAAREASEHVVALVAARSEHARAPELPPPRRA
jgi:hypothetical protein